jgi:hypothetical protein
MKKFNLIQGVIAVGVTAVLIFGYAYVAGKGWKESQK